MAHQLFRRVRFLGVLAAVMLSLSLVSQVSAAELTNGDFGTSPNCNLNGWQSTGDVSLITRAEAGLLRKSINCMARISSEISPNKVTTVSRLAQTFTVPSVTDYPDSVYVLTFSLMAKSTNGYPIDVTPPLYTELTQGIRISDSRGWWLYEKLYNIDESGLMTFGFVVPPGETITIELYTWAFTQGQKATLLVDDFKVIYFDRMPITNYTRLYTDKNPGCEVCAN